MASDLSLCIMKDHGLWQAGEDRKLEPALPSLLTLRKDGRIPWKSIWFTSTCIGLKIKYEFQRIGFPLFSEERRFNKTLRTGYICPFSSLYCRNTFAHHNHSNHSPSYCNAHSFYCYHESPAAVPNFTLWGGSSGGSGGSVEPPKLELLTSKKL